MRFMSMSAAVCAAVLGFVCPVAFGAAARDITSEDIVDAPKVLDVQMSPDGRDVLYEVRRTLREQNAYVTELWVRDAEGRSAPRRLVVGPQVKSQFQSLHAQWAPDGKSFAYFATRERSSVLMRFNLADAREEVLLEQAWSANDPRGIRVQFAKFSPDGKTLAFAAVEAASKRADPPMRGIVAGPLWPRPLTESCASLWLLDLATKSTKRMTQAMFHVSEVAWSPDGQRIAFAAAPSRQESPYKDDLYLLDVRSGAVRPLVQQPGWDRAPVWSPDGKSIAFVSQKGDQDWSYASWIAVVAASGGAPRYYFEQFQQQSGSGPGTLQWTANGHSILFTELYRFGRHLFEGTLSTNQVRQLSPNGAYYQNFSFSADARRLALSVEDVTTPADVHVVSLPWRESRKLSNLHPAWSEIRHAGVQTTKWRSKDDRFDMEGVVILPPDYRPRVRYPTLVYMPGGPSMPRMGFVMDEAIYPFLVFAARGYVVFVPNNRGRGGFGSELREAIPRYSDFMPGPFSDVMGGVDGLIARGIADPERLAFSGFSFGGGLASYVLAHTTRFKAGGIFEGYPNTLRTALRAAGSADRRELLKDQAGFGSPWNERDRRVLWENSPIYAMDAAKTPTLLEFGELSAAHDDGNELYAALQFFGVPSLYIVYPRTGHGIDEPKLMVDSYERQLAWFDYWVLGKGEDPRKVANAEAGK